MKSKPIESYSVWEMLSEMPSERARLILTFGIIEGSDAATFPAIKDLLERDIEDDILSVLYYAFANQYLDIGAGRTNKIVEFILEHCHRDGDLYCFCRDVCRSETLGDLVESRRLTKVPHLANEYTFVPAM